MTIFFRLTILLFLVASVGFGESHSSSSSSSDSSSSSGSTRRQYNRAGQSGWEFTMMVSLHPRVALNLASISSDSKSWAREMGKQGYDENELRHKLWASMLLFMNGEEAARSVASIHEGAADLTDQAVLKDSAIDDKNNSYGFKLGQKLRDEGYFFYSSALKEAKKRILEGTKKKSN